ncbi:MAG TPA: extracellular solute-binding protein [Candidatus Limnocylindrales bacterium]|nr:extracellular solute-binding protein [Candidatus Limnocylindrales bacterium]
MTQSEFERLVHLVSTRQMSRRQLLLVAGFGGAAAVLAACGGAVSSLVPSAGPSAAPATTGPTLAPASPSAAAISCDLPTAAQGAGSVGDTLAIYNWAQYLNPDNKTLFGKLYGVTNLTEDVYPSNEDMLAKLQAGGIGQYDIVVPTGYMVETMVQQGLAEALDTTKIPNLQYVDDRFKGLPFDTGGVHYAAKDWGTTGFGWRSKFIKETPASWADFWTLTTGKYSGKVNVLDSAPEVIGAALKKNGFSYNSVDPTELQTALNDLLALKPHLASISSDYIAKVESGDLWMGLGWNGDFSQVKANKDSADAMYVVPSEGSEFWVDTWVIPKNAPHLDAALAFINFILTPSVQGKETDYTYYASPETGATPCIDTAITGDPSIYPSPATIAKLEAAKDLGANQPLRDKIWTQFKSA